MTAGTRHQLLLTAVAGFVLLTGLGWNQVWDVDEAIFAQSAWEMMDRGDLVVPYFNGEVFPDKPPLMYWGMIAAYKTFGETEFAARFWSAVFGIGGVLVTYHLGRRLISASVGFWAGLILATSLNFDIIGRAATPDAMLVFFSALAMLVLVRGCWTKPAENAATGSTAAEWTGEPSWRTYAAAYAVMGVGVLVKGPVAVVLPTAVWGLFLLFQNLAPLPASASWQLRLVKSLSVFAPSNVFATIWRMRPLTAFAAVIVVAGPWFAAVSMQTSGGWLAGFIGVHNVGRFLNAMDNHQGPLYYYLVAVLVGFFPWSILLIPAGMNLRQSLAVKNSSTPGYLLACCWFAVWVGFFSLAKTKLPSYVVPAYPAMALLMAGFVHAFCVGAVSVRRLWLRISWTVVAVVGVGILVGVPFAARRFFQADWTLGLVGLVPLLGAAVGLWYSERNQTRQAMTTLVVTSMLLMLGLFNYSAYRIDRFQNSGRFADVIRARTSETGKPAIGTYFYMRPSLVYYTKGPIQKFTDGDEVQEFFATHERDAFMITTDDRIDEVLSSLPGDVCIIESSRVFLKNSSLLLLGRQAGAPSVAQSLKDRRASTR